MGLVINKPADGPAYDELMAQLGVEPAPPRRRRVEL